MSQCGITDCEIGTYDGDRTRKHGVLRVRDDDGTEQHLRPPRYTLLCNSTMMGDAREMFKTFRPSPDGSRGVVIKPSPLVPHTRGKYALWLYEKYMAEKSLKPDRIDGIDVGKCDATCVTEIVAAEHEERKKLGRTERKWLTVVADEAHFMRNRERGPLAMPSHHALSPCPRLACASPCACRF